jgi:DNA polymerase III psi subunit
MNEPAPAGLSTAGIEVWVSIVAEYDLRPDELRTLEDACAATDMIAALSKAWEDDGRPLTTKGSMGQQVIHPLIGEIRTQRAARNALWRQLKLPDLDESPGVNQNRDAANASWQPGVRGRGA